MSTIQRMKAKMMMGMPAAMTAAMIAGVMLPGAAQAAPYSPENPFIAGVKPDQRPAGAPVIKTYKKDAKWYARALTGIIPPYPHSLKFLESQGAWYNPFIHPGMLPPYDIRGWHKKK